VIDGDYRGRLYVLLFNHSDTPFLISPGDRVAQLVIEVIQTPSVEEVADFEAEATARGKDGFGSTGIQ
jgi:dUTP pyrophosphatase